MIDAHIRKYVDMPLNLFVKAIKNLPISPNNITCFGFSMGLIACVAMIFQVYHIALAFIILNRIIDGLDGVFARITNQTSDFGAYLDIVLDFIFYSGIIFSFALGEYINDGDTSVILAASFIIFSFIGTGTSFLCYGIIAEKINLKTIKNGKKSFFHADGLVEGTETIIYLILICLLPSYFVVITAIFGILCWITTYGRSLTAYDNFNNIPR